MAKTQRVTLKEAASLIKDGDLLSFSGFTIWRRPMALVYELVRQGKRISICLRLMEALTPKCWLVPKALRFGNPAGLATNSTENWVK